MSTQRSGLTVKNISDDRAGQFMSGMMAGLPIAAGYFAVSFALGIAAAAAGLDVWQGMLASLLCNASAGEYAAFALIAAGATYIEVALMTLVVNARYMLMSCALSQRFDKDTRLRHRLLIGFDLTDELFGLTIARKGFVRPFFNYGAMAVTIPCWAAGTALGILFGNILPLRVVSALSVALYAMFLAVIVPPARHDKVIAGLIVCCFVLSFACGALPYVRDISEGTRTIVLTVLISAVAAVLFPRREEEAGNVG